MLRRVLVETAVVVVAFTVTAALLDLVEPAAPVLDLTFATFLLWCLIGVVRLVWQAVWRARVERHTARWLESTSLVQAAQDAVVEERVRLAADIEALVRASVTTMGVSADRAERTWDLDPDVHLLAVQDEGARATSELRRMLGLLRDAETPDVIATGSSSFPSRPADQFPMMVVLLCVASVTLTVVEGWPTSPDVPAVFDTPGSLILTAVAAATVILCRRAPAVGAAACAAVFLVGAAVGAPVGPGSWIFLTPAVLAWSAAATGTVAGFAAVAALLAGIAVDLGIYMPINLAMCEAIVGVAAVGGAVVGWSNRRKSAAHQRVVQRGAELDTAAGVAVHAERLAVARDLHDVVSHGVAVMVMQAGAAAATRRSDPDRAQRALRVVQRTAAATLAELARLVDAIAAGALGVPATTPGSVERDVEDLQALVNRMEGAGLRISLHLASTLTGSTGTVVYRITQEALTNAARHAPGSRVNVSIDTSPDRITIDVVDDGPGTIRATARGYGLVGIAERVARLGGQLSTGPGDHQAGFRVSAQLPIADAVPR
ncbi:MAG TPA: histidine kinase [Microlunatus sp.]